MMQKKQNHNVYMHSESNINSNINYSSKSNVCKTISNHFQNFKTLAFSLFFCNLIIYFIEFFFPLFEFLFISFLCFKTFKKKEGAGVIVLKREETTPA